MLEFIKAATPQGLIIGFIIGAVLMKVAGTLRPPAPKDHTQD